MLPPITSRKAVYSTQTLQGLAMAILAVHGSGSRWRLGSDSFSVRIKSRALCYPHEDVSLSVQDTCFFLLCDSLLVTNLAVYLQHKKKYFFKVHFPGEL